MPNRSSEILDNVLIVGPDIPYENVIKKLASFKNLGRKRLIQIIRYEEEFEALRGVIGAKTRIDIYAHGIRGRTETEFYVDIDPIPYAKHDRHSQYVSMNHLIAYLADLTNEKNVKGLQIHLWSCYGGRGISSAQNLPLGAALIIHAPTQAPTEQKLNDMYCAKGIARSHSDPLIEFMHTLAESPNEASIAYKSTDDLFIYRSPLNETILTSAAEVQSQIQNRLNDYLEALNAHKMDMISDVPRIDSIIQGQNLGEYENETVFLHTVFDNDTHYIQSYLEKKAILPGNFLLNATSEEWDLRTMATFRMKAFLDASKLWEYIVENHIDINKGVDESWLPPLQQLAYQKNKLEGARFLLSSLKANVNALGPENMTALIIAAANGDIGWVKLLLEQPGILGNIQQEFNGYTALIYAAKYGFLDVVEALLQAEVDPTIRDAEGETALFVAAKQGHPKIVERLLQHQQGVKTLNVPDNNGLTPAQIAEKNGHINALSVLARANLEKVAIRECNAASSKEATVLKTADNTCNIVDFDYGTWDSTEQFHPITGERIFIYRAYKNEMEVGTASFYKHPLLCRSEAGDRHNIIATTGIFSTLEIDTHSLEEICQALPPTLFDRVMTSAKQGAQHGAVRGVAHLFGYTLKSRGVPQKIAHSIEQTICYGGYFLLRFNTYAAQEEILDWSGTLHATCKAALDTGSMFIASHVMQKLSQSINRLREQVHKNGFIKASKALGFFSSAAQYSVYAYDAMHQGIVEVGTSFVAGGLTQYTIEQIGERAVGRKC